MARYYRRRYTRTIVRAPKKRWASNIIELSGTPERDTNGQFSYYKTLAVNKSEGSAPSPVIVKTGNFKVQFDLNINVAASGLVDCKAFILYLPQGMLSEPYNYTNLYPVIANHPEWIIAWRQLDFGNANAAGTIDTSVVKFSSRLKRNLNTGDTVIFALLGTGDFTGITYAANIKGLAQLWTCAN